MELIVFLKNKLKIAMSNLCNHIKDYIRYNYVLKKTVKKEEVKIQYPMGRTNIFFSTLYVRPLEMLTTWLHLGAPNKIKEN
jgi:hypothetical protein